MDPFKPRGQELCRTRRSERKLFLAPLFVFETAVCCLLCWKESETQVVGSARVSLLGAMKRQDDFVCGDCWGPPGTASSPLICGWVIPNSLCIFTPSYFLLSSYTVTTQQCIVLGVRSKSRGTLWSTSLGRWTDERDDAECPRVFGFPSAARSHSILEAAATMMHRCLWSFLPASTK
jgi:hypothetical protein